MNFESAKAFKEEAFQEIEKNGGNGNGNSQMTESLAIPRPDKRISIGYSLRKKNDYLIELRVQRKQSWAYKTAKKLKEKAKGEAVIEIIPSIELPSYKQISNTQWYNGLNKRHRPLMIGLSICHEDGMAGTLGAFVDSKWGPAILSNNHVIAKLNKATKNQDMIYQPGRPDKNTLVANDQIATLKDYTTLSKDISNKCDAAIAIILEDIDHLGNIVPRGFNFPNQGKKIIFQSKIPDLYKNKKVCKIGRTTGYTIGMISAIDVDGVPVKMGNSGIMFFENLIEISWISSNKPFTLPGDSGSLVYTQNEFLAFGLHFAGGIKKLKQNKRIGVSYSCNLGCVLNSLNLEFLE